MKANNTTIGLSVQLKNDLLYNIFGVKRKFKFGALNLALVTRPPLKLPGKES